MTDVPVEEIDGRTAVKYDGDYVLITDVLYENFVVDALPEFVIGFGENRLKIRYEDIEKCYFGLGDSMHFDYIYIGEDGQLYRMESKNDERGFDTVETVSFKELLCLFNDLSEEKLEYVDIDFTKGI